MISARSGAAAAAGRHTHHMRRTLRFVALAALSLGASCIGPNNAFRSVQAWNSDATGSKWANEAIHVAFWIVPVYQLTLLGDIVIFNSVEFWGGNNPVREPKPFTPADQMDR